MTATASAARRARLLRLRSIEHRIAAAKKVQADAAHAAIASVADRVSRLRDAIHVPAGVHRARDLQAATELSDRLDRARAGLDKSLTEADILRAAADAERIAARFREDRTTKVHAAATRREDVEREHRAAAARPAGRRKERMA